MVSSRKRTRAPHLCIAASVASAKSGSFDETCPHFPAAQGGKAETKPREMKANEHYVAAINKCWRLPREAETEWSNKFMKKYQRFVGNFIRTHASHVELESASDRGGDAKRCRRRRSGFESTRKTHKNENMSTFGAQYASVSLPLFGF